MSEVIQSILSAIGLLVIILLVGAFVLWIKELIELEAGKRMFWSYSANQNSDDIRDLKRKYFELKCQTDCDRENAKSMFEKPKKKGSK